MGPGLPPRNGSYPLERCLAHEGVHVLRLIDRQQLRVLRKLVLDKLEEGLPSVVSLLHGERRHALQHSDDGGKTLGTKSTEEDAAGVVEAAGGWQDCYDNVGDLGSIQDVGDLP